ncbi:MAG: SIMPL domain-containing protein [Arcobacter sp.]|uniref:SIMPL domain-containing protein n=1 Tax=Arcobacter sp. TaxID=1872629 RepID=UPI003AFFE7B9
MKKYLFLLIPFILNAYEINFSKKFTKDLIPNILGADISIIVEDKREKEVIERLDIFNNKIKEYNKVEKQLGTFNIRPQYQRSSNSPKIYGYKGTLNYKVETTDALNMGEFISMITSLKEDRDTSVSLNNLSWRVKDDSYNVILDLLRLESIEWVENYAKNLSADLNRTCSVKVVDLRNNILHTYRQSAASLRLDSSLKRENVPVPEVSQQKISITTNYKLECK